MNNICIVCFNHQKFDNNLPLSAKLTLNRKKNFISERSNLCRSETMIT